MRIWRVKTKNRLTSIWITGMLTIVGILGFITFESEVVSSGSIIYVGSGPWNDSATINGGIAQASHGDTVFVYSDIYNEIVTIDKSINLIGEDKNTTIIDGGGGSDVAKIYANWVNITGFTFRNSGSHSSDSGLWVEGDDNTIFGNNFQDNTPGITIFSQSNNLITKNNFLMNKVGIYVDASSFNNITNNNIISNTGEGIFLYSSSLNFIINNNISSNGEEGIMLRFSSENTIICNNISSNGAWGIRIAESSDGNNIINNNFSWNNYAGVEIYLSNFNNLFRNNFSNDGVFILGSEVSQYNTHNITTDNIVNGKPLYYYKDARDFDIDGIPMGELILTNCTNIDVRNLQIYNTDVGIEIAYSMNILVTNNTISSNSSTFMYGIYLYESSNNNISENKVLANNRAGLCLWESSNSNIIGNNNVNLNLQDGLWIYRSHGNHIIRNNIFSNGDEGILFTYSSHNDAMYNNISLNKGDGISIISSWSEFNTVKNNSISNNYCGINVSSSTNNFIFNNRIIENTIQAADDTNTGNKWDIGYPRGGNYWSDFDEPSEGAYDNYTGPDQDVLGCDGIVDKGIIGGPGKNPYVIDSDSHDNYPLLGLAEVSIPPPGEPILYINKSLDGEDIILYWDPPSTPRIDHYLIYRSTSQTGFDFNDIWVNTSVDIEPGETDPIPLRTMWNDTNAADPSNLTSYEEQYYYVIRAVNELGQISRTSRTVGKWTKTFPEGVSSFSLPLEPLKTLDTYNLTKDMNADYIRWMDPGTHVWKQHDFGDSMDINNTNMILGESYEVKFNSLTNYTFTGLPGAMIIYDNDTGFLGFDYAAEAKNLTVSIEPNGNVTLTWEEPASMNSGDWYEVYYSNTRDGLFGTFNVSYFLVSPPVYFGNDTTTHIGASANDPGSRLYYMVVPFNASGVRGASTYSIGIWTEEYISEYDTFGIPLKLSNYKTADWYCDNIPDTVGMNYYIVNEQRWGWHSERMPAGAYDPVIVMTEGYQISTSSATKFIFIGV